MSQTDHQAKHLEFIQAAIARQAGNSFAVRGWSITVSTAAYGYTVSHLSCWLAVLAILPPLAFAGIDLYYLRQERLFRELYTDAIKNPSPIPAYSMDTSRYIKNPIAYPHCTYWRVIQSRPLLALHLSIIAVGLIILGVAIFQ